MINTKSFAKQRIWSRSETSANNRSRTSVCLNLFSSVYSVILMGFLMIINHSVCFLVWYVTYQYISHLGCLNFFSLFKIFNMQFSKNNQRNFMFRSGDKGIRTLDPLLARQVLSQLSYTPIYIKQHDCHSIYINICKPYYIFIKSGSHLLSHTVSSIVSSAA